MHSVKKHDMRQAGFSLVELMVGLVIGLLATLVIMQVFSVFEGQKRSTSGTADAQTNGTLALMYIQRSLQTAGYGMPMPNADPDNNILNCDSADGAATFPVEIQDGGGTASDTITVRYSGSGTGAVPIEIYNDSNVAPGLTVSNNIGCASDLEMANADYKNQYRDSSDPNNTNKAKNMVMVLRGNSCTFVEIADQPVNQAVAGTLGISHIRLKEAGGLPVTIAGQPINKDTDKLACMGSYGDYTIEVLNDELVANNKPIVSEVVRLHAQYGVSDSPTDNEVKATGWVDAKGTWAWGAMSKDDRNRIRAVRVAVVLRNGLKEKEKVTSSAPTAWHDSGTSQIAIDVSDLPDWEYYRYRVFSTTVPLRNMLWSKNSL
jgi:type IV pilus assembly protein PilW